MRCRERRYRIPVAIGMPLPPTLVAGARQYMQPVPEDVIELGLGQFFRECNERPSRRSFPTIPISCRRVSSVYTDRTFIAACVAHHAQFLVDSQDRDTLSRWLAIHFLLGADIGVLIYFRQAGTLKRSKVASTERSSGYTVQQHCSGGIDKIEILKSVLPAWPTLNRFSSQWPFRPSFSSMRVAATVHCTDQVKAIADYEKQNRRRFVTVYNPWRVPFTQRIHVGQFKRPTGSLASEPG